MYIIFTILLSVLISPLVLFSQIELNLNEDSGPITEKKICYSYSFSKGDTLEYLVYAFDSITFPEQADVLKARKENFQIICDSVSSTGNFFLRHTLLSVEIFETTKGTGTLTTTKHPWIGKDATIEIDSLGKRYSWKLGDSSKAVMSPGGAFQSVLFFPIKDHCVRENSSWLVEAEDYYPENGLPVSNCNYASLFRTLPEIDTLGFKCNRLQYAKTGKSSVELRQIGTKTSIFVVSNSFGKLAISKSLKVPIHFFSTIEQKLQIINDTNPNTIITGKHHITSNVSLVRLNQMHRKTVQ